MGGDSRALDLHTWVIEVQAHKNKMKNHRAMAWLAAGILFSGVAAAKAATPGTSNILMMVAGLCLTGFGSCRRS